MPGICTPTILSAAEIGSNEFPLQPGVTYIKVNRETTVPCAGKMADDPCTFCSVWGLETSSDQGQSWDDADTYLWPTNQIQKQRETQCKNSLDGEVLEWFINVTPSQMPNGLYKVTHGIYRGSCMNPPGAGVLAEREFTVP